MRCFSIIYTSKINKNYAKYESGFQNKAICKIINILKCFSFFQHEFISTQEMGSIHEQLIKLSKYNFLLNHS